MTPKISIVTICYNSAAHIEEAILSVLNQSYENKEYIVIDGGSKDTTLDIIAKYRDKIDYFVSEPDKGISDAFNKGIKASTGDIIGICNSDDILAENVLQIVADNYEEGIEIYRMDEIIKDFDSGEEFYLKPTLEFSKIYINAQPCHMGCFVTQKAYNKYGLYDIEMKYCMDGEFLRRLTYKGAKYKYIPQVCGYFRKGGASSTNEKRMRNERRIIVTRYGGNKIDAELLVLFFMVKKWVKRLVNVFGAETSVKLRSKINA